jgi:hypothetical protein
MGSEKLPRTWNSGKQAASWRLGMVSRVGRLKPGVSASAPPLGSSIRLTLVVVCLPRPMRDISPTVMNPAPGAPAPPPPPPLLLLLLLLSPSSKGASSKGGPASSASPGAAVPSAPAAARARRRRWAAAPQSSSSAAQWVQGVACAAVVGGGRKIMRL